MSKGRKNRNRRHNKRMSMMHDAKYRKLKTRNILVNVPKEENSIYKLEQLVDLTVKIESDLSNPNKPGSVTETDRV